MKKHELSKKYLKNGQSGIVTFGLKKGFEGGKKLTDSTKIFSLLANFGDSKSLIIHPASTTHQQLSEKEQEKTGVPVILYDDGEGVKHEFTDKLPITNFPLKQTDLKDAPVVIYEFPIENPPYGLYVAGIDPYRQGKSAYSSSLGSVYIYKRMHAISGEKYQDMFVASYCARPDKKETWEEQTRYLIKYYNARALCENDEISFIDYMINKGDAHYLEKQPQWLKEIVPNTTVRRDYGIHRSSEKIRDFLHSCLKKYTEAVSYTHLTLPTKRIV